MELKDLGKMQGKIMVFGGPYSNLQATQKVRLISEIEKIPIGNVICTGDVIAYCGQPEGTAYQIKRWGVHTIIGNVEEQLRSDSNFCNCNFEEGSECDSLAKKWYPFTRSKVSKQTLGWMKSLPNNITFEFADKKFFVAHGSSSNISEYIFKSTPWEVKQKEFEKHKCDVVLAGHCGIPFSDSKSGKYWINAGVIGMPANDGTARVWYVLIEETEGGINVQHKSFEYNHEGTIEQMKENKLPEKYAKTLETGIWPNCDVLPEKETSEQGKELEFEDIIIAKG